MSLPNAFRIAASSPRPNAPGSVASGRKYRAIRESSPDAPAPGATISATCPYEFVGAKLAGDLVEYRVHHAGFISLDESMCDVDIFRNDDTAWHVLAMLQFIRAGAQHRAQDRVDPLQGPAPRQRLINQRVEPYL